MRPSDTSSIPDLFADVVQQLAKLVHNELQLARAELSQKWRRAEQGAILIAAAAILIIPALVLLLISFALFLVENGFSPVAAHLISALVGVGLSIAFAAAGMNRLKAKNLKPQVTLDQLERDVKAAKDIAK
jgi:hypothetical protein